MGQESYKASTSYSCNSHIEILMLKLLQATLSTVHGDNKVVDKEFVVLAELFNMLKFHTCVDIINTI